MTNRRKKLSRRDFARTSATVGAAAFALPQTLLGKAALGKRPPALRPPGFEPGGDPASAVADYRDSISLAYAPTAAQNQDVPTEPETVHGWRVGTTIPAEYYTDERHYLNDEKLIAQRVWLLVDHETRIARPGDYFVFEFGRGESVIVLRDKARAVKAYHNICRHRGSRLCRHDDHPAPQDAMLSVRQLGPSGNTPVFRCPYHAWTYDLDGRLLSAPNGMPSDFDFVQHGLIPCHVRTDGGFIFANVSRNDPPDFEAVIDPSRTPQNWRAVCANY